MPSQLKTSLSRFATVFVIEQKSRNRTGPF